MANNLREYRNKILTKNVEYNRLKENALKKLDIVHSFANDENVTITFEELKAFGIGERININDDVVIEKTFQSENKLVFLTFMLDGGAFGVHNHDCYEVVKVLKGNLFEKTRGLKVYTAGEEVIYAENETHIPYSTENSTYKVTFYKELFK